jgi:hypothetical protein
MFNYDILRHIYRTLQIFSHINSLQKSSLHKQTNKNKLWGLVRQRTVPTERLLLVGEVNANFSG